MENRGWIMLSFLVFKLLAASSQVVNMQGWYSIDCGSDNSRTGMDTIMWDTDAKYTSSGDNKRVQETQPLNEMNTLRIFPNKSQENCYTVPAYSQTLRYLVRAGFYYGNYDGLSRPPTFDLHIDGEKWSTVNMSSNGGGAVYHEAIYVTHGSGCIKVCMLQTQEGEVPFISSVELVPLWVNLYSQMENNATFHLVTRTNLGGEEIRFAEALSDEKYNRIWTKGTTPSNCIVDAIVPDFASETENDPPLSVLLNSIHSVTSDAIILTVNLSQLAPQPAYFVFYLTESILLNPSDTRIVQIMINGRDQKTVAAPDAGECRVVTIYPLMVAGPTINVTLAPASGSSLPPLIAAMEISFTNNHCRIPEVANAVIEDKQLGEAVLESIIYRQGWSFPRCKEEFGSKDVRFAEGQ
ncbi:hypothetical protein RJ639_003691 [Escallonia herrerae]|uniref:Malectin-like domain-containing protein n=1 Tax=Escallonia herrerae TaxID=1293975 RepID=A0AA88W373_9ASTE|nr:hypothetical protein RJ639_003691 [Escallonia herrerae]